MEKKENEAGIGPIVPCRLPGRLASTIGFWACECPRRRICRPIARLRRFLLSRWAAGAASLFKMKKLPKVGGCHCLIQLDGTIHRPEFGRFFLCF